MQDNQVKQPWLKYKQPWLKYKQSTTEQKNPGGGEIFRPRADRPWGLPNRLYNAGSLSPGVNLPELVVNHPRPSSTEVKERVELCLYSSSGPSWPVLGRPLP
jgi:hypothetical protein